jgi:FMN phosphatase YigB (HAD superfamily)
MVGDRLDNDIAPGQLFGCQTWHVTARRAAHAGSWSELLTWLKTEI